MATPLRTNSPTVTSLLVLSTCCLALVRGQLPASSSVANLPGARTATGIMASASDGMARYLAPDGPIQPAITAIGGLPLRGAEMTNQGISQISSRLDQQARNLAQAGGQSAIRMPGMEALESAMPASVAQLGDSIHGVIRQKNNFIRGQAERGIEAGQRLRNMMQQGLQGVQARSMGGGAGGQQLGHMMGQAQEAMMRGSSQLQSQLKSSLDGHMNRLQGLQGIGDQVRSQAQGISRTLSNGLQGAASQLQSTGDQVRQQLQSGHQRNSRALGGILGSMQGSMGQMGSNMQKNLGGVMEHAQNAAQTVTESLRNAISAPLNMAKNLGDSLMKGAGGGIGSMGASGGRY